MGKKHESKSRQQKGAAENRRGEKKSSVAIPVIVAVVALALAAGGLTLSRNFQGKNALGGRRGAQCCQPLFLAGKNSQKVAIVSTIWKSESVLWQFLCYHFSIGVDHVFLMIDSGDANDPQVQIAREFGEDRVTIWLHDDKMDEEYRKLNMWAKFGPFRKTEVMARQLLNMELALRHCIRRQIDWLISIDSDELFFTKEVSEAFSCVVKSFMSCNLLQCLHAQGNINTVSIGRSAIPLGVLKTALYLECQ